MPLSPPTAPAMATPACKPSPPPFGVHHTQPKPKPIVQASRNIPSTATRCKFAHSYADASIESLSTDNTSKRTVTGIPPPFPTAGPEAKTVPLYVYEDCRGTADYASACSCYGFIADTLVLPTSVCNPFLLLFFKDIPQITKRTVRSLPWPTTVHRQ